MADPPDAIDTEALAAQVVEELDPGSVIDDKVVLSRRQLLALTGGGAGLAALGFGTGQASAADGTNDTSVGDVGAAGDSVDVYVDELRDDGGDEWLDVDDTGQINAGFGRTWAYDTLKTDDATIGADTTQGSASDPVVLVKYGSGGTRAVVLTAAETVTADNTTTNICDVVSAGAFSGVAFVIANKSDASDESFVDRVSWARTSNVNKSQLSARSTSPTRSYGLGNGLLDVSIDASGASFDVTVWAFGGAATE